ncbi:MAG: Fe-S cluster assembly protein SufB, partial [Thermofilum sp.]|nr:Fe-S cluster assembly protein SufB [Thermofilum sp.]
MSKLSLLEGLTLDQVSLDSVGLRARVTLSGRISRSLVEELSRAKKEPEWMLRLRLRSLELFEKLPMPNWLVGIEELNLEELAHYIQPDVQRASSWEEL